MNQPRTLTSQEVKAISTIAKNLPELPMLKDGKVVTRKVVKRVKGSELKKMGVTETADNQPIDEKLYYSKPEDQLVMRSTYLHLQQRFIEGGVEGLEKAVEEWLKEYDDIFVPATKFSSDIGELKSELTA